MDYTAWLRRCDAMGIVRLGERDAVRISTDTREREGPLASSDARVVGQWPGVVPVPAVEVGAREGARHSAADRVCGRRGPTSEGEGRLAS